MITFRMLAWGNDPGGPNLTTKVLLRRRQENQRGDEDLRTETEGRGAGGRQGLQVAAGGGKERLVPGEPLRAP